MKAALNFRMPPEWERHDAVWTAWPWDATEWGAALGQAQGEFVAMCRAISDLDTEGKRRGEVVRVLVSKAQKAAAEADLAGSGAEVVEGIYGDIWLRDTGPIVVRDEVGALSARSFQFNGWGGKYVMAGDEAVPAQVLKVERLKGEAVDLIFEGGSIDVDGAGNAITTRECLLNTNRNPGLSAEVIEGRVKEALGIEQMIWIDRGLMNDHTDGHLDNVARFVGPKTVLVMKAEGADDPNAGLYERVKAELSAAETADGGRLTVVEIPSPGRITNGSGAVVPASHLNFYIANTRVVVPYYETVEKARLVAVLQPLFPDREIVVIAAPGILAGGGSFHCITQQIPIGNR